MLAEQLQADFDAAWYAATYPAVAMDIATGRAQDAADHYQRLGRFRGYLPYQAAPRPDDAARYRSKFGGLWIDHANAPDLLEGRRALGWIDDRQHDVLSRFIRDGYVILPGAVPEPTLSAARAALEDVYEGRDPDQFFICESLNPAWTRWVPELKQHPAKAVEVHWRHPAILEAAFAPAVAEFLALIFERPALLSQTLGFWRGSAQAVHQDSAYVAYTLYPQFAASWVALEDVTPGAGELCYYPGSQHFPEHLFHGRYKVAWEANRREHANGLSADTHGYERTLPQHAAAMGLPLQTFLPKAGDVLIWAADLAHGGSPISGQHTRKSVVSHYCPWEVAPTYFEEQAGRQLRRHASGHWYSSWST